MKTAKKSTGNNQRKYLFSLENMKSILEYMETTKDNMNSAYM